MKYLYSLFIVSSFSCYGQFAPPAGQTGSTAIEASSSQFVSWAHGCELVRGYANIANTSAGYASAGSASAACGKAMENGIVTLGDGGIATLTFPFGIMNGSGADFAVFENSFSDDFLELAFVEVSSDGINFFRFPATSNTQTTTQVESFGLLDATKLNNLAGKYRGGYGTPFDLEELKNEVGLDVNKVTHVRIIDVVGTIDDTYATKDKNNNKINDPYPTEFAAGGFDLDAVGVIHQNTIASIKEEIASANNLFTLFPNPASLGSSILLTSPTNYSALAILVLSVEGKVVFHQVYNSNNDEITLPINAKGSYFICISDENGIISRKKLIINE